MNDFDFLKEFGKNLDKAQPHDFTDADWKDMDSRLEAQFLKEKKRLYWKTWMLPLAAALGFLTMGYALWENMLKSAKMQSEIQQLKVNLEAKNNIILQQDTVVRTVNIIKFDTVYRTVILTQKGNRKMQNSAINSEENDSKFHQNIEQRSFKNPNEISLKKGQVEQLKTVNNNQISQDFFSTNETEMSSLALKKIDYYPNNEKNQILFPEKENLISTENTNDKSIFNQTKGAEKSTKLLHLNAIKVPVNLIKSINSYELPDANILVKPVSNLASKSGIIRKFRPHNFTLGIHQGAVVFDNKNREANAAFTKGLSLEMALTKRLHLLGGIDFAKVDFEVKSNDLNQFDIPIISPPAANYTLIEVQIKQPFFNYSMGLRYDIFKRKRLQPYFTLAYVGEKTLDQSLDYDFYQSSNGDKVTTRRQRFNHDDFTSGVKGSIGVDWLVFKRWSLGMNGYVQNQYSHRNSFLEERVGLIGGIKYHF
jgi:hypothetical protein